MIRRKLGGGRKGMLNYMSSSIRASLDDALPYHELTRVLPGGMTEQQSKDYFAITVNGIFEIDKLQIRAAHATMLIFKKVPPQYKSDLVFLERQVEQNNVLLIRQKALFRNNSRFDIVQLALFDDTHTQKEISINKLRLTSNIDLPIDYTFSAQGIAAAELEVEGVLIGAVEGSGIQDIQTILNRSS